MVACLYGPSLCNPLVNIIISIFICFTFLEACLILWIWSYKYFSGYYHNLLNGNTKNMLKSLFGIMFFLAATSFIALIAYPDYMNEVAIGITSGIISGFFVLISQKLFIKKE